MTFCYMPTFDVADPTYGFSTITMSTAGKTNISVDVAALAVLNGSSTRVVSLLCHHTTPLTNINGEDVDGNEGALISMAQSPISSLLQAALRTDATAKSWTSPSSITVSFSMTTFVYTIAYSGAAITAISWANAQTRALFGYASNFSGSSNSVASTLTPRFVITPTLDAVSVDTDPLNVDVPDLTASAVNSVGQSWGLFRSTQPFYRSWRQEFETKAKTLRQAASTSHPSTFQELFEVCRTTRPFVVVDGWGDGRTEMFYLKPSSSAWKPERAGGLTNDAQFHVAFDALVAGVLP